MVHLDSNAIAKNERIDNIIRPYSSQIDTLVSVVVGYNAHAMHVKKPESDLGNLLADYLLEFTEKTTSEHVDLALFNSGGFRIPLPPGKITVGHVMQLMPFDNTLVLMTLSGKNLQLLAEQIIEKGGDPIAGRSKIQLSRYNNEVTITLDEVAIDEQKQYRILTSSYLAEGGDGYSTLLNGTERKDTGVLIRDAIQKMYQQKTSEANPAFRVIEGRILLNP